MKIFPKEIIENTAEVFKFRHTVKSKIIYSLLLLLIIGGLVSLPFIKVDVYTSSQGIIKPNLERSSVSSINAGRVVYSNIENNKTVKKGDTLLFIESTIIDEQLSFSQDQIVEIKEYQKDLRYLLAYNSPVLSRISSNKYRSDFLEHEQLLIEAQTKLDRLEKKFIRNKKLFDKEIIAASEFENIESEYKLTKSNVETLRSQQKNKWQSQLITYNDKLEDLQSNTKQLLQNKSQYYITAPVSGTLMNTRFLSQGSFISQGSQLAEISPSSDLIAECYISPSDIGLIDKNNQVIFQIDAYNYNQWGLAHGEILEINKDIELLDDTPLFKIRCKIDEKHLKLNNGVKGELKKGMTFTSRFLITERTLYQLLYDKVDDWVNPANA